MNGLSVMKRTASTSSSILAVSSAITFLSGKPRPAVIMSLPSRYDLPRNGLAAAIDQRFLVGSLDLDLVRRGPGGFLQRDGLLVGRQPIMLRPVERRKGFELVERAFLLENLCIALDRHRGVEQAGDAVDRE